MTTDSAGPYDRSDADLAQGRQQLVEMAGDRATRALVGRADALVDGPGTPGVRRPGRPGPVHRDRATGRWQAPFVMGVFNRQVVHRSNALAVSSVSGGICRRRPRYGVSRYETRR